MSTTQEIHDLIQQCPVQATNLAISTILDIVTALNDRISEAESVCRRRGHDTAIITSNLGSAIAALESNLKGNP